jgi:hypothetical protein
VAKLKHFSKMDNIYLREESYEKKCLTYYFTTKKQLLVSLITLLNNFQRYGLKVM